MRTLQMLLICLYVIVSISCSKRALRFYNHPSLIKHNLKDSCKQIIDLSADGRNSGGLLSLNISQNDIGTSFSCTTALRAPEDYRILVAFKKIMIPKLGMLCSNYIKILDGGFNSTDYLSNKICGYYDGNHSPATVYYSRNTSSTLSVEVSKQAYEDYSFKYFGFTLSFTVFNQSKENICLGQEQMLCDNGNCIWKYFKCNDHNNCGDGSDEKQCKNHIIVTEEPESFELHFPTSLAAFLFIGILMILLTTILLVFYHRKHPNCCGLKFFLRGGSPRHRATQSEIAVMSSEEHNSNHLEIAACNLGFVTDEPPSYEQVMASEHNQCQSEASTEPPNYSTVTCTTSQEIMHVSSSNVHLQNNELPALRQVFEIKI